MKAVVIGALAATAYSTSVFSGVYTVGTKTDEANCCYPTTPIKVTQPGDNTGDVGVSVTFPNTDACKLLAASSGLKGTTLSASATPSAQTAGSTVTVTTSAATGTKNIIFTSANGATAATLDMDAISANTVTPDCLATLTKSTSTWSQAGLYEVDATKNVGTATDCCFPTGDIEIEGTSPVSITWTFDSSSSGCATEALRGDKVTGSAAPDANNGDVYFTADGKSYTLSAPTDSTSKSYVLDLKTASKTGTTACSVTLKTKTLPTHSYNNVYEVATEVGASTKTCCYPDANGVKVTQDSTTKKVTVGWTFENTDDCYESDLKGKAISAEATPSAVTGDVKFSDEGYDFKLDYPSTATGAWSLDLSSIATGCAATLEKKDGYLLGLGSLVALSLSYIMF